MPTNITPVDDWQTTDVVQGPATGDAGSSAAIRGALQVIENRLERVANRVPGLVTADKVMRIECTTPFRREGTFPASYGGFYQESIDYVATCSGQYTWHEIPISTGLNGGGLISYVRATFDGNGCTVLPTTMPRIKVYRIDLTTGTATQIGATATDGSGTTGAFNTIHNVDTATLSYQVITAERYMVEVYWGNGGTLTDLRLIGLAAYVRG